MNAPFPIIRIELEGMRHAISHAMSSHLADMDAGIQEALKEACANYNYQAEVGRLVNSCIQNALAASIEQHFRYGGEGRKAIDAVVEVLARNALQSMQAK